MILLTTLRGYNIMTIIIRKQNKVDLHIIDSLINDLIKADKSYLIMNTLFETKQIKLSSIEDILKELKVRMSKANINHMTDLLKKYNINLINDHIRTRNVKPVCKHIPVNEYQPQEKIVKRYLYI